MSGDLDPWMMVIETDEMPENATTQKILAFSLGHCCIPFPTHWMDTLPLKWCLFELWLVGHMSTVWMIETTVCMCRTRHNWGSCVPNPKHYQHSGTLKRACLTWKCRFFFYATFFFMEVTSCLILSEYEKTNCWSNTTTVEIQNSWIGPWHTISRKGPWWLAAKSLTQIQGPWPIAEN